jgi:hypothetical protein
MNVSLLLPESKRHCSARKSKASEISIFQDGSLHLSITHRGYGWNSLIALDATHIFTRCEKEEKENRRRPDRQTRAAKTQEKCTGKLPVNSARNAHGGYE